MKIWTFIFPAAPQPYCSIRVAAENRIEAEIMAQMLDPPPALLPTEKAGKYADGSFLQYAGEIDGDARILRMEFRTPVRVIAAGGIAA